MALKYAILGLLHYRDMHGYQITKHIENNFGHMWSINYGQIYPNLQKLRDEGLILMIEVAPGEKGPQKKRYSITPKGREEFSNWLNSSPEKQMLLRDPFLMRFVFFGFGDHDRSLEIIDEQIKLYEQQLVKRKSNMERWEKHDVHVQLMAELGVRQNEMFLAWLKRSREIITEEKNKETAAIVGKTNNSM